MVRRQAFVSGDKADLVNVSDLVTSIRDLIVYVHRGNTARAESVLNQVADRLADLMTSGLYSQSATMGRAQQTMFALDEVRLLLAERDLNGALIAARDAGKEWNSGA
jgi:hypothetical protein